mmetsp:Transcript_23479/g.44730  ORF Transcript_23479/g.44730 Transcript_23479/m.44730 type:complete len:376 (+) Transcript_23479:135-1262(+)
MRIVSLLGSLISDMRSTITLVLALTYLVGAAFCGVIMLVMPLMFFVRPFARRYFFSHIVTFVFGNYWFSTLFVLEQLNGTKIRVHGEIPKMRDAVLVVCNHKCDLDYCYLWSVLARVEGPRLTGLFKAVLKSAIKVVPVFSWGMKACGFLYLSRSWDIDRSHIKRWAQAMSRDKIPMWLVLYPEGTRYTDRRKASSDKYAKERSMPCYESELLLPRTKGLVSLVRSLDGYLDTVLDMTIAYVKKDGTLLKGSELGTSALKRVFSGDSPVGTVHMHFAHHHVRDLPADDEALASWCQDRWALKDKLLLDLGRTGNFGEILPVDSPSPIRMYTTIALWLCLMALGLNLLFTTSWFVWYCVFAMSFGVLLTAVDPPEW